MILKKIGDLESHLVSPRSARTYKEDVFNGIGSTYDQVLNPIVIAIQAREARKHIQRVRGFRIP